MGNGFYRRVANLEKGQFMALVRRSTVHLWHKKVGLGVFFFVIVLGVSGLLLNHTEELSLDEHFIHSGWLLAWYGIDAPSDTVSYPVNTQWVHQLGERVYLDDTPILNSQEALHAAVVWENFIVLFLGQRLALVTLDGELVEYLGALEGLPGGVKRLGIAEGGVVVDATDGIFSADAAFLAWRKTGSTSTSQWAEAATPPDAAVQALLRQYQGKGLSVERVVLDLHSGRILGLFGVIVMDLAALGLVFAGISGMWVWWQRRRRQSRSGDNS